MGQSAKAGKSKGSKSKVGKAGKTSPAFKPAEIQDKALTQSRDFAPKVFARQAVVVLAMHRSGSSALARVLNLLGCDLPQTLMGGDASNETGHWESTVVRALNDDVLASGGSVWQDWHAFNPAWYGTTRPAEFLPRAREVLETEYGATTLMVLKDPRICRIFPFWRDVLESAGIAAHVIIPLRHPAEVAASLQRRNAIPEVQGLLLWLRHVLEAEHASRGLPRAVISYNRLMTRPSEVMRAAQGPLGVVWPRLSDRVSKEIDAFMSPHLRHHKVDGPDDFPAGMFFRDWLAKTFGIFLRWSEQGEDSADHAELDQVRAAMQEMAVPLGDLVVELARQASEAATLDKEVRYLRGEAGKRADAVTALTTEKQNLNAALITAREALAKAVAEHNAARSELELTRDRALSELAKLTPAYEALTKDIEDLRGEAGKRGEAVTALTAEKQNLGKELEAAKAQAEAQAETLDRLNNELTSSRAAANERIEALTKEVNYLRGEAGKRGEAVAALTAEKQNLGKELEAAKAQAEAQAEALDRLTNELTSSRAAADEKIEALTADLEAEQEARALTEAAHEALTKEVNYLRGEAGKRGEAVTALTAEKQNLGKELEAAKAQAEAQAEALDRLTNELTSNRAAADEKIKALTKEVDDLRGEAGKRGEAVTALTAEKQNLGKELEAAKAQAEAQAEALDRLTNELTSSRAAADEKIEALTKEVDDLRSEAGKQGEAIAALNAEKQTLFNALEEEKSQARAALESARAEFESEAQKSQSAFEAKAAEALALTEALKSEIAALREEAKAAEARHKDEEQRLSEELSDLVGQNLAQAEQLQLSTVQYQEREKAYLGQAAVLQQDIDALTTQLEKAQVAEKNLQNMLLETQSALVQRQHEAEETAGALKVSQQNADEAKAELDRLKAEREKDKLELESIRREAKGKENARYDEISDLTQIIVKRDATIAAQASRIHAVNASYADINTQVEHLKERHKQAQTKLEKLTNDLKARDAALDSLMGEINQRGAAIGHLMHLAENGQSLTVRIGHAIDAILSLAERPWLRGSRKLARKAALLHASGLFDAKWYAQAYPDVVESKLDPASHFVLFGRAEGRHPLPDLAQFLTNLPKPDKTNDQPVN